MHDALPIELQKGQIFANYKAQEGNGNHAPSSLLTTLLKLQNKNRSSIGHYQYCEKAI